uniref:Uncharacterized protein n=1 Tax=Medicago truncatula TaxID=3880 RepID=Q2HT54_MEDTR|nr:hypothetical protein MtrDRAFT_AC150777g27v1 [Medicago truncatula]
MLWFYFVTFVQYRKPFSIRSHALVRSSVTDFHVQGGLHDPNLESLIGSHEPAVRIYIGLDKKKKKKKIE